VILSRAAAGLACLAIVFSGSGLALEPPLSAHAGVQAPAPFSFNWTEKPTSPMPWNPTNWDVIVHSRDQQTWSQLDPVQAQHGADCGAPPATHVVTSYEDAVFVCNQHMMTAINARGYGEIMFTPDHLADWTNQPVVIDWQQSTLRTSARDWTDVTITPFLDNLVLPAHTGVDLLGRARNAVNIEMLAALPTTFVGTVVSDFTARALSGSAPALEQVLPESARVRTHYQLEISRTHIRFGLPDQNVWWIDSPLPELGYTTGLVQWGHHSYSPNKGCEPTTGVLSCTGDTWHWSNFSISPSIPFTMLRGNLQQHVSHDTSKTVEFVVVGQGRRHLVASAVGTRREVRGWIPAGDRDSGCSCGSGAANAPGRKLGSGPIGSRAVADPPLGQGGLPDGRAGRRRPLGRDSFRDRRPGAGARHSPPKTGAPPPLSPASSARQVQGN
jgi:hypothetical protein